MNGSARHRLIPCVIKCDGKLDAVIVVREGSTFADIDDTAQGVYKVDALVCNFVVTIDSRNVECACICTGNLCSKITFCIGFSAGRAKSAAVSDQSNILINQRLAIDVVYMKCKCSGIFTVIYGSRPSIM